MFITRHFAVTRCFYVKPFLFFYIFGLPLPQPQTLQKESIMFELLIAYVDYKFSISNICLLPINLFLSNAFLWF